MSNRARAAAAHRPVTKLAKWRECSGPVPLTPTAAARHFGISRNFYEMLERGEGECPPSLALHIATKTNMTVMPGDLPGCTLPEDPAAGPELAPPPPAAGDGEAARACVSPSKPFVQLIQSNEAGQYAVAVSGVVPTEWQLFSAREAADFGMDLIRAALLAARPGSVPA